MWITASSMPQNLVGKRTGELALYGHDAGVIPKGILSDDFGVKPEQSSWVHDGSPSMTP